MLWKVREAHILCLEPVPFVLYALPFSPFPPPNNLLFLKPCLGHLDRHSRAGISGRVRHLAGSRRSYLFFLSPFLSYGLCAFACFVPIKGRSFSCFGLLPARNNIAYFEPGCACPPNLLRSRSSPIFFFVRLSTLLQITDTIFLP